MNDSIIHQAIQKSNRTWIVYSTLGILALTALFFFNTRYFYNFIFGPFPMDGATLSTIPTAAKARQYWLRVTGDEMLYSGFQYVNTSDSGVETVEYSYYAMVVNDRLLLVQLKGDRNEDEVPAIQTGWLEDLTPLEQSDILSGLEADNPGITDAFLSVKLVEGNFRTNGFIGIAIGLVILGLSGWGYLTAFHRMNSPEDHPIMKKLAVFGQVDIIVNQIEMEMISAHTEVKKLHLTQNWLVYLSGPTLIAIRLHDIVWMYKHVMTQRYYGIPINKTYSIIVFDRFKKRYTLPGGRKEKDCDAMLQAIHEKAPWSATGYSQELESLWKKNPDQFIAGVIAEKDQRPQDPLAG